MIGKGKYDEILSIALEKTSALQGLLLVLDGSKGAGFSLIIDKCSLDKVPLILRYMADEIEKDVKGRW